MEAGVATEAPAAPVEPSRNGHPSHPQESAQIIIETPATTGEKRQADEDLLNGNAKKKAREASAGDTEVIVVSGSAEEVKASVEAVQQNGATPWEPTGEEHSDCRAAMALLQGQVEELRRKLQDYVDGLPLCPICLEVVHFPVELTDCRHLFCCDCIFKMATRETTRKKRRQTVCPVCRAEILAAPRAPPIAFVNHITKMREAAGLPLEKPGGNTRAEFNDQLEELRNTFKSETEPEAVFDSSDNVWRCPRCLWEVADDGKCENCDWVRQDHFNARSEPEQEALDEVDSYEDEDLDGLGEDGGDDLEGEEGDEEEVIDVDRQDEEEAFLVREFDRYSEGDEEDDEEDGVEFVEGSVYPSEEEGEGGADLVDRYDVGARRTTHTVDLALSQSDEDSQGDFGSELLDEGDMDEDGGGDFDDSGGAI